MVTTATQRLLDLAALAPASHDEELLGILHEAHALYQQGFETLRGVVARRADGASPEALVTELRAAGVPCDLAQDPDELVLLLAITEWEMTPAALAYSEMADAAARRGVCLIPED